MVSSLGGFSSNPMMQQQQQKIAQQQRQSMIQQRYDADTKHTYWGEIDPWLNDELYLHPKFYKYFKERAAESDNDIYPTVSIRQIMWALKMKPMRKEQWETCFDRKLI